MLNRLSESEKLKLICVSLLLILGLLAFCAIDTVQAMRSFQQQYNAVKMGDVSTVHPWMTVHVISHVYHVPENYLADQLTISNPDQLRHSTLYEIASRKRQPVARVVHTVQQAILVYRKDHSSALFVLSSLSFTRIEPFLPFSGGVGG
jgi:hypothetical protein